MIQTHRLARIFIAFALLIQPMNCAFAATPLNPKEKAPLLVFDIYAGLLKNHRIENTGLFVSFLETRSRKLSQQASTYDQAVVGLLALRLGDDQTVEQILRFFDERWGGDSGRGLSNFYNAYFNSPGIEKTVTAGPNAWVGLLAARAARLAKSETGLKLALKIGHWMARGLPHRRGGIAMGLPNNPQATPWSSVFSTENNISYHAFLSELLRLPLSNEDRTKFERECRGVETWLTQVAYKRESGMMLRGVNPQGEDHVQALDAYTCLFLGLGPQKLRRLGLNPRRLMRKIEKLFEVTTGSRKGVDSTDAGHAALIFTRSQSLGMPILARPRGHNHRLIWYEGLGQYILCLKRMAPVAESDRDRSALKKKAGEMTQSFDWGNLHPGQTTPQYSYTSGGELFADNLSPLDAPLGPSPALISSAWRAFVELNYNPMVDPSPSRPFSEGEEKLSLWKTGGIQADLEKTVFYGMPEEMLNRAWACFQQGKEDLALNQAYAVIEEWSPWAHEQQAKKKARVGGLITFDGSPRCREKISSYGALNDVSAACFLVGKIFHRQGKDHEAKAAFDQIFKHYSLGQVWDPNGWFWSPAQAAFKDFFEPYPKSFGLASPLLAAELPDEVALPN